MTKRFIIRKKGFFTYPVVIKSVKEWNWTQEDEYLVFTITTNRHTRKFFIRKESVEYFGEKEEINNV